MTRSRRLSLQLSAFLLGLALLLAPALSHAFLSNEVIEAAYAVAAFKSTPRQEALVFLHNKELNLLAVRGQLPPEVYQRNQKFFETVNKGFVQGAAKEAGLVAKTQAPKPGAAETFNPGTDTDIIVESGKPGDMITEAKIQATEDAYQKQVKDYLKGSGIEPPAGKVNTDTDFMPHPDHTTPAEFTKINEGINKRGGTAYESPNAAKVEAQMRPPEGKPISNLDIGDTGAYVTEMQNLANHKIQHADELDTLAKNLKYSNPAKSQALEAESQLLRSQASKYIDRIDKVTDVVAKQNGIDPPAKPHDSLTQAGKDIGKGRGATSKQGADVIGDMGNLAVNRGVKDYSETLSKLAAKDPAKAAAARQQIAEQVKHMSPEMREQVVDKAKKAYTNSGGADPDGFGKDLSQKANNAAADYQKKHPPSAPDTPTKPVVADGPNKPARPDAPDTPVKPGGPDAPTTKTKVIDTIGTIMVISDIGNACETLEKYLGGEISGKEAAETLVDQTLTLGLIGAGKKVSSSWDTYWDINRTLRDANKQNVTSYFTQWEIQLRKAGIPADQARRMVGQAMISGDTGSLENLADRLRNEGKNISDPKLVIESMDYGLTEYGKEVLEQTWDTGKGMLVGVGTGVKYIVTAPSRIVEAWAQGELAEAELELQSATQEAWMKARLFQRLLKSGIPPREALKAINNYFDGTDMKKLRDIFRKLRGGYVTSHHSQKDWYCTNRPEINAPVSLPPILNMGQGK